MRNLFAALAILSLSIAAVGCSGERSINAANDRTLYRSVKIMKEYLPSKQRVEFEVAFWTLKESAGTPDEFRDVVDGKTASELIALGKKNFAEQRAAGVKSFQAYASWEAMIDDFLKERSYLNANRGDQRERHNKIQ